MVSTIHLKVTTAELKNMQNHGFSSLHIAEQIKKGLHAEEYELLKRQNEHMVLYGWHVYNQAVEAGSNGPTPKGLARAFAEWRLYYAATEPILTAVEQKIEVVRLRIVNIDIAIAELAEASQRVLVINDESDDEDKLFTTVFDEINDNNIQDIDEDSQPDLSWPDLVCNESLEGMEDSDDEDLGDCDDRNELYHEEVQRAYDELLVDMQAQRDNRARVERWACRQSANDPPNVD